MIDKILIIYFLTLIGHVPQLISHGEKFKLEPGQTLEMKCSFQDLSGVDKEFLLNETFSSWVQHYVFWHEVDSFKESFIQRSFWIILYGESWTEKTVSYLKVLLRIQPIQVIKTFYISSFIILLIFFEACHKMQRTNDGPRCGPRHNGILFSELVFWDPVEPEVYTEQSCQKGDQNWNREQM